MTLHPIMTDEQYTAKENARATLEAHIRAYLDEVKNIGLDESEIAGEIKDAVMDASGGKMNLDLL